MKIFYLLLAILLFPVSTMCGSTEDLKLNSDLIAYDGFSGNDFGWQGSWFEYASDHNGLEFNSEFNGYYYSYSKGEVSLSYKDVCGISVNGGSNCVKSTETNWGDESKALVRYTTNSWSGDFKTTFYVSFLAQLSETPKNTWSYLALGAKQSGWDAGALLGTMNNKNKLGAVFSRNGSKKGFVGKSKPVAGQTYMIVAKFSVFNSWGTIDQIDAFINPTSLEEEQAEFHSLTKKPYLTMGSIDLQSYFYGVAYFDEIRMGRTWASVVSSLDNSANLNASEDKVTTFNGPTGSWSDETMWSNGLPNSEIDTVIIEGSCEVSEDVKAKDLVVKGNGKLFVKKGGKIETENPIVLQAGVNISAEYEQEASVENHYVEKQEYFPTGQWNFVCMPYSMTADELFPDLKLASSWRDRSCGYFIVNYSQENRSSGISGMEDVFEGDYELIEGRGYMVWVVNDKLQTFKYESSKNEVSVSTTNTIKASLGHAGWNLVGNPFSHSMTYEDVFENSPHNQKYFTGAVYVYDGDGYKVWTNGVGDEEARTLAPMEAFFVKRTSDDDAAATFFMTDDENYVSLDAGYVSKLGAVEEVTNALTIGVNMMKGYQSDYTYIKVANNASVGMDEKMDALKYETSNAYKDIIYSTDDAATCFAANAVSLSNGYCEVPLVIDLVQGSDSILLTFILEGDSSYNFSLVDDDEMTIVPLSQAEDIVSAINQEDYIEGRFSIFITKAENTETALSGVASYINDLAKITTEDKSIVLESLVAGRLSVSVIGVNGLVLDNSVLLSGETVNKQMNSGVYLVRLSDGSQSLVRKLIIN